MDAVVTTSDNLVCGLFEDRSYKGYTLPDYIRQKMGPWKNAIAFESQETGVKYTYSEVLENSSAFAAALIHHGFKKRDLIAVILPNIPEYASIVFGIWEAGLVASLMNPAYTTEEITYQLHLCGIKSVITNEDSFKKVENIDGVENMIMVGEARNGCVSTYHEMILTGTKGVTFMSGSSINTETETALLLYSSGTTGLPKAVMLTHENVTCNAVQFAIVLPTVPKLSNCKNEQERLIAVLPFFHSYGFQGGISHSMIKGVHTLTMTKFQPSSFIEALRQHRPTFLVLVPTVLSFLTSDKVTRQDLESTRFIQVGGCPTPPPVTNQFNKKFSTLLLGGYGLTELSPMSHLSLMDKPGSIGLPIPMTCAKVVDLKTGKSLGKYANGEICVKGPQVMKGYFNNEAATKAIIDQGGWLHTGDWGYYDDENDFIIVDRIKDIIKVKGFQVSPTEIENMLNEYAKVADVAVIGIPDAVVGELPRAYVVAKDGVTISTKELHEFISGRLANFKELKGGIEFVDNIPRSPTGKILRKDLLKSYNNKQ